jgi:hypothetical protein
MSWSLDTDPSSLKVRASDATTARAARAALQADRERALLIEGDRQLIRRCGS